MSKYLINLSNHNSSNWSPEQKVGWLNIIDIPFPAIDPNADTEEIEKLVEEYLDKVNSIAYENIPEEEDTYVMLQGEFTFCYLIFQKLLERGYIIAIPTTERKVVERVTDEGVAIKTSEFKFVRWRYIKGDWK